MEHKDRNGPARRPRRLRVLLSWSSGKDSAWTLHVLRAHRDVEVVGLLTTFNQEVRRAAMHAVRKRLVEAQAQAVGLPLWEVGLPSPCPNAEYERRLGGALERAKGEGVRAVAFGDLFLTDVRAYRERLLRALGLEPLFPLWGRATEELAREMVRQGLRAYLTCVDPRQLDPAFAGRLYDARLLAELPPGVDPCGERGEFHTFAFRGPMFRWPIPCRVGAVVERGDFVFADLLSTTGESERTEQTRP